ncbi:hypothetical protein RND71_017735 [Anisodus tanguticus]|uniref:F-box protein n=1 Tax=Anisodus tanguticus TaxID=243964 RepID=A0AAE1S416_9SOLA|nr:hypothetical protein RND71_017735 [Anisodus tanguticus]
MPMAQEMPDWSELQYDLLVLIATRFNLIEDYLNFGTVCKSWHCVATKNNFNNDLPRAPWLMLAEEEDNEVENDVWSLWVGLSVGEDEGEISLLHPFSGVQIVLPHQNTTEDYEEHQTSWLMSFIRKAVLSASPSHTSDYVLVVIEGGMRFLSLWRPGDLRWTRVMWEETNHELLADLVYFNGQIYAVDYSSQVLVCDVADVVGPEPTKSHIIAQIPPEPGDFREHLYIVESLGFGVQFRGIIDDSDRIPLTLIPEEVIEEEIEDLHMGRQIFEFSRSI